MCADHNHMSRTAVSRFDSKCSPVKTALFELSDTVSLKKRKINKRKKKVDDQVTQMGSSMIDQRSSSHNIYGKLWIQTVTCKHTGLILQNAREIPVHIQRRVADTQHERCLAPKRNRQALPRVYNLALRQLLQCSVMFPFEKWEKRQDHVRDCV